MVKIEYISGVYVLVASQTIKASLNDVWLFFSNPKNLNKITPLKMKFNITSGGEEKMYKGQIITYTLRILYLIRTNWVTEITNIVYNKFFVDEQRLGPYKIWHHQHHFKEVNNGIEIYDKVVYKIPFGWLGRLVNSLYVKRELLKVFNYRASIIHQEFGS